MAKKTLGNWRAIEGEHNRLLKGPKGAWIFRGQSDGQWPLQSSLDRAFEDYRIPSKFRLKYESAITKEFKRYYHLYSSFVPGYSETLTYLTLMQHFGAPTRLLDWTYSFYVALYFAVEQMKTNQSKGCVVFAINRQELDIRLKAILGNRSPHFYDRHFRKAHTFERTFQRAPAKKFVYPLNAFHLNERSAIQQGLFLCQSNLDSSFEEHLLAHLRQFEKLTH